MNSIKYLWIGLVVVAIIAILGLFVYSDAPTPSFGGVTNYDEVDMSAMKVGPSTATRLSNLQFGTCSLIAGSYTVAASTTVAMDCAITGVVSTDGVFAQFATSTINGGGWSIRGASASSTAGFVTISVVNATGGSGLIPASLASSTKYIILRTQSTVPGL